MVDWGDLAEPMGPPTPYQRRLHAYATAGPHWDNGPMYYWVVTRDEEGCVLPFYAEPLDARLTAERPAFVRLLDGPAAHPRSAVGVGEPATRPESPNAPPARPLIAIMWEGVAA